MTHLFLDARSLASGIGTYGFNLLSRLGTSDLRERMHVITSSALFPSLKSVCDDVAIVDVPIYSVVEQFSVPRQVPGRGTLHALHYNAPVLHRGPLLVTIHDLTHMLDENYRRDWRSWVYSRPMLFAAARRADHIFTGSEYVKQCIKDHLKVAEEKITICSYGVGEEFVPGDLAAARETVRRHTTSASPYLLFVGNLKPHKNVGNLLRAYSQLSQDPNFEHRLVIVGDDRRGRGSVLDLIRDLKLAAVVQVIAKLPQPDLIDFYRAADLLVLPSFQEGFGLPIAEAMACGTPVVCSRAAAMPEVGGDVAEYFDPHCPDEIAHTIAEVLGSPEKRQEMIQRGPGCARKFTWEKTFQAHLGIYREYLPQGSAVPSLVY